MRQNRRTEELSLVETRKWLTQSPERLEAKPATLAVTRRGKPMLAILSWVDYESITETLDVLSDDEAVRGLRQGILEVKEGRTIPWEQAKRCLQPGDMSPETGT